MPSTILIHGVTFALWLVWLFCGFFSMWISGNTRRYDIDQWWSAFALILLPLAIAAMYALMRWRLFGLPVLWSVILLAMPSLLAIVWHGDGIYNVLTLKTLHRSPGIDYVQTRARAIEVNFTPIPCDSASFRVIEAPYARDRSRVFYFAEPVADADPETFSVFALPAPSDFVLGRDRSHFFVSTQKVVGLNPHHTAWKVRPGHANALGFSNGQAVLLSHSAAPTAIPGAHASLRFLEPTADGQEYCVTTYLLDEQRAYHVAWDIDAKSVVVQPFDVDTQSFHWIRCSDQGGRPMFDAEDRQHRYLAGKVV